MLKLLLLSLVAALVSPAGGQTDDFHFPVAAALRDASSGIDASFAGLSLSLKQHAPARTDGNVVLSPLSIAVVLEALQMGAQGITAQEIGALLGQGSASSEALWAQMGETLRAINASTTVLAQVASALFVDASFVLNDGYRQSVRQVLSSEEYNVDFANNMAALGAINAWVSTATNGRITRIVEDLDSSTALVVASAIYFNGAWESPFPLKLTSRQEFRVSPHEVRTVDLMTHAADVPYAHSSYLRCKVLGLPYKGRTFAMYVLLPDDEGEQGVRRLEADLTPTSLLHLLASATVHDDVIFMLPRFTLEASFSLKSAMQASGVNALFDPLQADLSGLVVGGRGLSVADVVHRVRVEVTETGTEAVAATAAWVTRSSHPTVRADRPFLFAIQHLPSRTLLFWGSVVRP